jgi:hypothetical protein
MAVVGGVDQSMGLFTLVQNEGAQRETKYAVPEVRRPLLQDESKDRQVQREPNAQNRQHGRHGQKVLGSPRQRRNRSPACPVGIGHSRRGPVPTQTQLHQLTTVKTYFNSLSE